MNDMDEITYWIHTKRAPCLFNYDNTFKKQENNVSSSKLKSSPSLAEDVSPSKKKRKLSILDEDSGSERQQNVFFETSQKQNQKIALSSCKSDSMGSKLNFNIRKSSIQDKPKRIKLQKNSRSRLNRPKKLITSTPKVTSHLRRSLRSAQKCLNSTTTNTREHLNFTVDNGNFKCSITPQHDLNELTCNNRSKTSKKTENNRTKPGREVNGQFEYLSDVSGFTANYIRSTKIQSTKTPRKLRGKNNRILVKESQNNMRNNDSNIIICANKSVNTGLPEGTTLNHSTDSSQNVINLVTLENNNKSKIITRGTSMLQLMNSKINKSRESKCKTDNVKSNPKTTISFNGSNSRYPKRIQNNVTLNSSRSKSEKVLPFNNSDRKENPQDHIYNSKTRSGRSLGLTIRQEDNSVMVLSNSMEPSPDVTMNVAGLNRSQNGGDGSKKKRVSSRNRTKRTLNRNVHLSKDSLREQSGFSACFSDSDDDKPLKPQKFFC